MTDPDRCWCAEHLANLIDHPNRRIMIRRIILALGLVAIATLGLTSCQVYPSGCVRIEPWEIPWPNVWSPQTLAVHHQPAGQPNAPLQFVGISGARDQQPAWHGPPQYTGWAQYASAMNCYQSNGSYAG